MSFRSMLLFVAIVLGCGGSDSGPTGPVSGTTGGAAFTTTGAVAYRPAIDTCTNPDSNGPVLAVFVQLSADFDTAFLQANNLCSTKAASREVYLGVWKFTASGDIAPGTYWSSDARAVFWWEMDSACQKVGSNVLATYGYVTIETNDADHIVGSLKVTFPGGDHLAGRFDAPVVASLYSVCEWFGFPGGTPGPGCPTLTCVP